MSPAVEIGLPRLVDGRWQAAAIIHFAEGPAEIAVTVPSETVARYLARLGSWVAWRELESLGAMGGWATVDRRIEGRQRATELVAAALSGDYAAEGTIRQIRERATHGDPAATEAASWIAEAEQGQVGCGGVGCCHVGAGCISAAPTATRGTPRDPDYHAWADFLRQIRRGLRLAPEFFA